MAQQRFGEYFAMQVRASESAPLPSESALPPLDLTKFATGIGALKEQLDQVQHRLVCCQAIIWNARSTLQSISSAAEPASVQTTLLQTNIETMLAAFGASLKLAPTPLRLWYETPAA
jgi:hypothetical protein